MEFEWDEGKAASTAFALMTHKQFLMIRSMLIFTIQIIQKMKIVI
jgi:hypothetical protein